MTAEPMFDVLTTDCVELQELLAAGSVTSVDIIEAFLDQIERHNTNGLQLNAMINTTPKDIVLEIARERDQERSQGIIRGPLHGIPITVKNAHNCRVCGSEVRRGATVVDMLVKAGAIIIGKANLPEMAGWKGIGITTGWSAVGGQTQSPYIVGGVKPGEKLLGHTATAGSSSGSAHGVAAGFAPLALATETDGSIVQPANRAALYGLKATVGLIPTEGTSPWSPLTDSIGGMARTPADLAALMSALIKDIDFSGSLTGSWEGQRVGFVDPKLWSFVPFICDPDPVLIDQQRQELADAANVISTCGGTVKQPVPLTSMDELLLDGEDALEQLWNHDFEKAWNEYLKGYDGTEIHSQADIVEFNKQHPDDALPPVHSNQELLEGVLNDTLSEDKYAEGVKTIRNAAGANGIEETLNEFNLDVILGPMDGKIPTVAAAYGYPVGTMPLGYSSTNGRPFGACIISRAGGEASVLQAMSAWHATMPARKPPPQLVTRL